MQSAAEAQRAYERLLAERYPPHDDPAHALALACQKAEEFCERHLCDALEHHDPRSIDAVGHAADKLIEALDAAAGEMQQPVKARFVPESV